MSKISNLYSQGGGGTAYEFEVLTAFMIQFLIGGVMPGIANSQIKSIRFQSGSIGYQTDDLYIECLDNNGGTHRVLFQIKHKMSVSKKDPLFLEVMKNAWLDFKNVQKFNPSLDKIYIIKSSLSSDEKTHLKTLCGWAKVKSSADDFVNEINRIKAKKEYLDVFRTVISENSKEKITDEDLFQFFICFDIIEYDFGESSSTSKNNFLTVIDYSKSEGCELLPLQIWDSVLSFVSNADNKGGAFINTNPPPNLKELFKRNYFNDIQNKLLTLSKQSYEITDIIEDKIGGISMHRRSYSEKLNATLNTNNILIISGEPGSGKTVLAKQLLDNISLTNSGYVLVFKADELNNINLRDYFLKQNIQLTLAEIFSFFPLHSSHFVFVDSLEKLLEGEGTAFRQLQKLISKFSQIKIIATCREANLPLIRIKFFSDSFVENVQIKLLEQDELLYLGEHLPTIKPLLQNKRLNSFVSVPKYLDFAFRAILTSGNNFSDANEPEFIQSLWEIIIENRITHNVDGMPARRSKQFSELAVTRARKMVPYCGLENSDAEALHKLEKEGVIYKAKMVDAYTPTHDILEDWALIRFVDDIFLKQKKPFDFFNILGSEPAMRRAFRLWIMQGLKIKIEEKLQFFSSILNGIELETYWRDESLIALLNSSFLKDFLELNKDLLLENDWKLLCNIVHLMRVSCRQHDNVYFIFEKIFVPIGNCWEYIFNFIHANLERLPKTHYDLILSTIEDWHYAIYKGNDSVSIERKAGYIVKYLFDKYYIYSDNYYKNEALHCAKLMLDCCGGIPEVIKELIQEVNENHNKEDNEIVNEHKKGRYFEKVTEIFLSGICSTQVAKHIPELLIKLLKKDWIFQEPDKQVTGTDFFYRKSYNGHDSNYAFGLTSEYRRQYFPASAFQTPIYWLLIHHTETTISFIIELMNYSTTKYIQSGWADRDAKEKVTLYMPDGKIIEQHGSEGLWCMFRGSGIATPYLLQSVLMALEKYLLELAAQGSLKKEYFQSIIEQLYTQSTTAALTAVIASVAQAYPLMIGKWVVPLVSSRRLMYWDILRYGHDYSSFKLPTQPDDRIHQKERDASNQLPHRLQHDPGIKGFIINYCFNYREYNSQIFGIFDKHKKAAKKADWEWRKILFDIDIRNWKVTKSKENEDRIEFQIEPVPKGKFKLVVDKMKSESEAYLLHSDQTNWLLNIKRGKKQAEIYKWREIVHYYHSLSALSPQSHHPGLAASIGVQFFWQRLSLEERNWCFNMIFSIATQLVKKENTYDFLTFDISIYDDVVFESIPLLVGAESIDQKEYILLFADILFSAIGYNNSYYNRFLGVFSNYLWSSAPEYAIKLWAALILFAKIDFKNPKRSQRQVSNKDVAKYNKERADLMLSISQNTVNINIDEINFEDYSKWVLLKVIKIIPSENSPKDCIVFLKKMVDLVIIQLTKPSKRDERYDTLDHHIQSELEEKIGVTIFWNANALGGTLFWHILDTYYSDKVSNCTNVQVERNVTVFLRNIIKQIISAVDANLPLDNDVQIQKTSISFKKLWELYIETIMAKPKSFAPDLLLLNIEWKQESTHWRPLEKMVPFFQGLIFALGGHYPNATVNLLSHIGDKLFLPGGFNLLWQSIKNNNEKIKLLSIPNIEKLVYRIYDNHLAEVRSNEITLKNYVELLDRLVNEGSSNAYWVREYLISFRNDPA